MGSSDTRPSYSKAKVTVGVMVVLMICCGEFVRIELKMKQQAVKLAELLEREHKNKYYDILQRNYDGNEAKHGHNTRQRRSLSPSAKTIPNLYDLKRELHETNHIVLVTAHRSLRFKPGPRGAQGPPGPPGGPRGPRGPPGFPGRSGKKGPTGPSGRIGLEGPQGPMGMTGMKGKRGMMGLPGRMGTKGDRGPAGPPGMIGTKGDRGPAGPQGMPGMRGDPGRSAAVPDVIISPQVLIVNESRSAVLHCSASGYPQPALTWSRVGGSMPSRRRSRDNGRGRLVISDVVSGDAGVYQCAGTSVLGKSSATSQLVVNTPPGVSLRNGRTIYANKGDNVNLFCHVTGIPTPVVTWSNAFNQLPPGRTIIRKNQFRLSSVRLQDTGAYICTAKNLLGTSQASTVLVVLAPLVFTHKPSNETGVSLGGSTTLRCAVNDRRARITWRREGGRSLPVGRSQVVGGSLTLRGVTKADTGVYTCRAQTPAGRSISASTYLGYVRLTRGNSGRIEVYYNGQWGTVCDDGFEDNLNGGNVVCRMLGYSRATRVGSQASSMGYGEGTGKIWLDDVQCTGTESSIFDCRHNRMRDHNCGHREDAGVNCE